MSTTTSNSKNATLSASTAAPLSWAQWFDWIVVSNETTSPVYVTTDGTAATVAETGAQVVLPGAVATFANRGLKPVPSQSAPGTTQVSLISVGTGVVVVSPQ